jgi:superfamily II DNA or RNA helicase
LSFSIGDQVRSRVDAGRVGVIRSIGPKHAGIQYYRVFWAGTGHSPQVAESALIPVREDFRPGDSFLAGDFTGYQDFQRVLTFQRLRRDRPLRNNVYAFNASRTRFFPYQFKPLIKFLDSPNHRILICDEVGLGKTIEAGLILTEMRARGELRSVLVVCPSNLTAKWRMELKRRFAEDFRILGAEDLTIFAEESAESSKRPVLNGIASYETLRSSRVLRALEELAPPIDLVIADEAHHMRNFSTLTRQAGVAVGANAAAMVLLTATPVHLGNENLFSLLQLLDEEDFPDYQSAEHRFRENEPVVRAQRLIGRTPPDFNEAGRAIEEAAGSEWLKHHPIMPRVRCQLQKLAGNGSVDRTALYRLQADLAEVNLIGHLFSRTRRRDVNLNLAVRKPYAVEVDLTPPEHAFYDAVTEFVRARAQTAKDQPVVVHWRINSIQRRAASSMPALVEYYRSGGRGTDPGHLEDDSSYSEDEELPSVVSDAWTRLAGIIDRWPENGTDSKYLKLRQAIDNLARNGNARKLVVFAFFRDTLTYLARRLEEDGLNVLLLHGGVPLDERNGIIDRFRDEPEARVLLSSRIGSEGLDLQFCDTVVNYDLPWSPMEVEQRIGRIDRIGQTSPAVHILNLWTHGTIEERILRRLYERIGVFERSVGSLDAILGNVMHDIERLLVLSDLTAEELEAKADQVAQALENELRQAEEVEGQAAGFVGLDDFFAEEIRRIRANRRYVTPDQLLRFLEDFLREKAPGSTLSYDRDRKTGRLAVDAALKKFLQETGYAGEALTLVGSGSRAVPITLHGDVACDSPGIEFLSVLHPLVRAIVQFHAHQGREVSTAHQIALSTSRLPAGAYVFAVYRLTTHAARETSSIEALFVDSSFRVVADGSEAEALLGEMLERGTDAKRGPLEVSAEFGPPALVAVERGFLDHCQVLRHQVQEENDVVVERRLASLRSSYQKNIQRVRGLLSKGESKERQERYLRMLRAQLTRLEGELATKERALEGLRTVTMEHEEVSIGIVEIEDANREWPSAEPSEA